MFGKLKQILKRWASVARAYIAAKCQKWNETSQALEERNIRQLGFQELTPLEEAKIRTGYWNHLR